MFHQGASRRRKRLPLRYAEMLSKTHVDEVAMGAAKARVIFALTGKTEKSVRVIVRDLGNIGRMKEIFPPSPANAYLLQISCIEAGRGAAQA